jgi:ubiquitin-conjugating enzyme E2 W
MTQLRVEFPKEYPTKPPAVYFLQPTPRHVHVYTNGDICLDLLGKGWRPQITVRTLAISILSMLSSCKEKAIPPDNANRKNIYVCVMY